MTFSTEARSAAIAWKQSTPALPDEARQPGTYMSRGPYPFCLPTAYAEYNLLPDARKAALDRFNRAGIPWHAGGQGRPCTHLLSSQVQCANALAPFVENPDAVKAIFGQALDIGEVLPFGDPASPDDVVVFEWTGLHDYLGERKGKAGTRGANTTSADAAIRYVASTGVVEIALIEWKYTEHYVEPKLGGSSSATEVRWNRYRRWWSPDGPFRTDVVSYESLFVEPLYQLMRQQLLAFEMESAGELGAEIVRVVHAVPARNRELADSLPLPELREAAAATGGHLHDLWCSLLKTPARFRRLDTASLVSETSPTSAEFKKRYGHIGGSG